MLVQQHTHDYLVTLSRALLQLDQQAIHDAIFVLMNAMREGRQIFLIGNGGSAALASHMACDLNMIEAPGLPHFRAIALTDNTPLITAWANDTGYENIFTHQLRALCRPGDVVLAISCSGNSPNVLNGVELARRLGATIIAFSGRIGGRLKDLAHHVILAPIEPIGAQEDIHVVLDHLMSGALRAWAQSIAERMKTPPKALILAAGKGTRLQSVLNDRPKPMAPLNGRPLLAYTIDWLKQYGIREIAINLHHHPQVITDYFGDGSAHDVRIHYAYEPTLLGTAGAVRNLDGFLDDGRPLLVVYGDVLTDMSLRDLLLFHHQNAANDASTGATLSLYRVPNVTEVGLVDIDERGRIHRFIEKPQPHEVFTDLANAGVLVLEPHVIEHIPCDGFCDFGRDLFPKLLAQDIPLYGWVAPSQTYILDIGTPEKYRRAQREWSIKAKVKDELTPQPQP